jgi:aspartyl protease family protein
VLPRFALLAVALCVFGIGVPKMAGYYVDSLDDDAAAPPSVEDKPLTVARPAPAPAVTTAKHDDDDARPAGGRRATLRADPRGHFLGEAVVNGRRVDVMVDTGATSVALTDETARRLGIHPAASAYNVPIATANGMARAAMVRLSEIRLGGVTVRNVDALVAQREALGINLLGMSFLSRLSKFEMAHGQLVLTE